MKVIICGDVCPAGLNEEFLKGDLQTLFHDVPSAFAGADRVFVNLECAVTDKDTAIFKKGPNLKCSPGCVQLLQKIGVTDCGLSNNHIFDYGIPGVKDTLQTLEEAGISRTGFGENYADARKDLVWECSGVSVAVIAVCEHEYSYALEDRPGARPFDPFDTLEDIRNAKAKYDYVIVAYHGGKEQSIYPSPRLRKACQAMVKSGASAVLCQHSHCIGCYEAFENGHILYGQGNFHFVEKNHTHPHWQSGLIVSLELGKTADIAFTPVRVAGNGIALAKGGDYQRIMDAFAAQSGNLHNGVWLEQWAAHCSENREKYIGNFCRAYTENANPDDNVLFNGRMHCEAHKDVIDWLCKHPWETHTVL